MELWNNNNYDFERCINNTIIVDVIHSECGVDCHKRCEKFIPNLCGVNQKILAEMLGDIRLSTKVTKEKNSDVTVLLCLVANETCSLRLRNNSCDRHEVRKGSTWINFDCNTYTRKQRYFAISKFDLCERGSFCQQALEVEDCFDCSSC